MDNLRRSIRPVDEGLATEILGPDRDLEAPYDLAALAGVLGASATLLEAIARAGLLLPHHIDAAGVPRYSAADADAVRSGLVLLEAGIPLAELLELATRTDRAVAEIAERAVNAFVRFVRDPVLLASRDDEEASERLTTAYEVMLPATERIVAHHLRRRLIASAIARLSGDDT